MKPGFMNPQPFNSVLEFGQAARDKVKRGLDTVCNVARVTIGPKGRNVFIDREWSPEVTNDGVTIIAAIKLADKFEDLGAQAAKQAAAATNDSAGDGTTTTAIIMQAVVEGAFASRSNPMELRDELNAAAADAVAMVNAAAKPIATDEDILSVATLSAESAEVGQTILDVVKQVGSDGLINVEQSQEGSVFKEVTSGFMLKRGYAVSQFQNNADTGQAVLTDTPVLVVGKRIDVVQNIVPITEKLAKVGQAKLAIFCADIDDAVVATFVANKQMARFSSVVVKGLTQAELDDVAALTGAKQNIDFDVLDVGDLGHAPSVAVGEKQTVVTGCTVPAGHVSWLKATAHANKNLVERDMTNERARRLEGKVATIHVGAPVESEAKYLLKKIEDAVQAVKAAADGGVVPGGGATLYRIGLALLEKSDEGSRILGRALQEPLAQILRNAGENVRSVTSLFLPTNPGMGWNARTGAWVNLVDAGIIDPAKVETEAIKNAVHAAATLATTEVAVSFQLAEGVTVK